MESFIPLEIAFRMQTPVCLTYPWIHFDALVAHLIQRKLDSHAYRSLPSKRVVNVVERCPIPLKKTAEIYHASISFFDVNDAYTTTIYKRFCEKYLDLKRIKKRKIDRARGYFRDFMINLVYIPARRVTFYACGDPSQLEELLQALPGLGKKVAIGFGFVKDFRIKETDRDYSIVKDGKATRPIPLQLVDSASEIVSMAYKPPYWAKENVGACVPPNAHVKLKEVIYSGSEMA